MYGTSIHTAASVMRSISIHSKLYDSMNECSIRSLIKVNNNPSMQLATYLLTCTMTWWIQRLHLAAVYHNNSVEHKQATTKSGNLRCKLQYSKATGYYVVETIKQAKDHHYGRDLLIGITDRYGNGLQRLYVGLWPNSKLQLLLLHCISLWQGACCL